MNQTARARARAPDLRQHDEHPRGLHRPRRHRLGRHRAAAQQRRLRPDPHRRRRQQRDCATTASAPPTSATAAIGLRDLSTSARTSLRGAQGPAGPAGPAGAPAVTFRAAVNTGGGTPVRQRADRHPRRGQRVHGLLQPGRERLHVQRDARRGSERRRARAAARPAASPPPRPAATACSCAPSPPTAPPPRRRFT